MGRIKEHLKKHKIEYLVGGTCILVGAGIGFFIATKQVIIVDAFNLKINSPTTNEVTTILARRGHPGNMIKCLETGEVFASQNRAADAMSLNPSEVSKVVRGLKDSAGGYHFENLGLAV